MKIDHLGEPARGVVLVSEGFLKKLKPMLKGKTKEKVISKAERFGARPTLVSLFKDTDGDKEKWLYEDPCGFLTVQIYLEPR